MDGQHLGRLVGKERNQASGVRRGRGAGERGRKGDLKSAAEEWETLRKREQSQLTHTHVCVCAGNSPSASCLEPFLTGVSSNSPAQLGSVRK